MGKCSVFLFRSFFSIGLLLTIALFLFFFFLPFFVHSAFVFFILLSSSNACCSFLLGPIFVILPTFALSACAQFLLLSLFVPPLFLHTHIHTPSPSFFLSLCSPSFFLSSPSFFLSVLLLSHFMMLSVPLSSAPVSHTAQQFIPAAEDGRHALVAGSSARKAKFPQYFYPVIIHPEREREIEG